jgi:Myb-like DNA-binding protein FlbD
MSWTSAACVALPSPYVDRSSATVGHRLPTLTTRFPLGSEGDGTSAQHLDLQDFDSAVGDAANFAAVDHMSRSSRRGPWLPEEDGTLLTLVHTQGPNNWVRISQHMQHRTPKQCRERYHQNLKPSLNHEPITAQEGERIEVYVQELGKRWAEIARRLGNRSDNAVKNWWNGSNNRRKRSTAQHGSRPVGPRSQPLSASGLSGGHQHQQHYSRMFTNPSLFTRHELNAPASLTYDNSRLNSSWHSGHHHSQSIVGNRLDVSLSYAQQSAFTHPPHLSPLNLPALDPRGIPAPQVLAPLRSDLQLPPLNCSDTAAPSPVTTTSSRASSHQPAPSLVSDNQSNCSISPKTVTSPRPGSHSQHIPPVELWADLERRNSTGAYQQLDNYYHRKPSEEIPYSSTSAASYSLGASGAMPRRASLPDPFRYEMTVASSKAQAEGQSSMGVPNSNKDARMTVSSLLH